MPSKHASKSKRNKPYRPRDVQADAAAWAMAGVYTLPLQTQIDVLTPVYAAVLLLKQGKATREDWNIIAQSLNVAEALAGLQIGPNLMPIIAAGQRTLIDIALRMIETGKSTCYAHELAAIDEAIVMTRAQLQLCTQAELSRALARVKDLHRSGHMKDVADIYDRMHAGHA
ncbi:MAG TPA: hypothetical protein VIT92_00605 [Burkholderiaceae bacterium]